MKCPYCHFIEDRVLETRVQKDGEVIRRRRECLKCKSRFSTQEALMPFYPLIIKKDGRRELFDREKILKGIHAACQKRPISLAQIEQVVEKISKWTQELGEKEVESKKVGSKVMIEIKRLDSVAYVRFASVYRTFTDVNDFLEKLEDENFQLSDENKEINV